MLTPYHSEPVIVTGTPPLSALTHTPSNQTHPDPPINEGPSNQTDPSAMQRLAAATLALPAMLGPHLYYRSGHPLHALDRILEPTAYEKRHDPRRPKTPADLAAMEAARQKRQAKAARKAARQTATTSTPSQTSES